MNNSAFGTITGENIIGGIISVVADNQIITNNYAGQTSLKAKSEDISGVFIHRVLSIYAVPSVEMDNTANSLMKLYNSMNVDYSSQFVSDKAGIDGLDTGLIFMPLVPTLPEPGYSPLHPGVIIPGL